MYYSHAEKDEQGNSVPTKLLYDHLCEVGNKARQHVAKVPGLDKKDLAQVAYLIGVCHDFGKYTSYFQKYLLHGKEAGRKHQHGLISALYAAFHMERLKNSLPMFYKQYLPLLTYLAVLHHHGPLEDVTKTLEPRGCLRSPNFNQVKPGLRERLLAVRDQVADLQTSLSEVEQEYLCLLDVPALKEFMDSWIEVLDNLNLLYYDLQGENDAMKLEISFICYLLYSALIDADKIDAAELEELGRLTLPADLVDRYIHSRFSQPNKPMDRMRQEIYEKVTDKIFRIPLDKHILTLTAPTGAGKTFASFSAALKLRKRIKTDQGYSPRIIYSLPYTSVIDQNHQEIEKVLQELPDFKKHENLYLLKHHHLTELRYLVGGKEELQNKALLRVERWQAEIVVTTFIQFLYSVIGYQNSFLKKFHNIAGSIILMDEVQNIDVEYWPLVRQALKLLTEVTRCYIILLTATKPLIFKEEETIELLEDHYNYFKRLDRVTIFPHLPPITVKGFCDCFVNSYDSSKSYMVVMNTIKSSIAVHKQLKERLPDICIFYLSTNIVPRERAFRIRLIRRTLAKKQKIIVVSTQVVEAGVDIDLDVVIRDLGPIDSIVQVAGRCNRHNAAGKGQVHIYNIVEENRSLAALVYGKIHSQFARELLSGQESLAEKQFYSIINRFFHQVKGAKNKDKSDMLIRALAKLEFSTLEQFELISNNSNYIDVFVEINSKAKQVFTEYVSKVLEEKDRNKRWENRLQLKRKFNSYILSIPIKLVRGLSRDYLEWGFMHLSLEGLDLYYNRETGFARTYQGAFIF